MSKITLGQDLKIEFGSLIEGSLQNLIADNYSNSRKVIIVDENTHDFCLDYVITNFAELSDAEIILLPCGEENKVMSVCFQVWEALSEYRISRNDLIINLGGGVVTDMGGFIASIYKRGVDFINIPTSLLAMVDASIGGKTGIDLGSFKNQLGTFTNPKAVFIDQTFLITLPQAEFNNGFAEMLKHALIEDEKYLNQLLKMNSETDYLELILKSVEIKSGIISQDPLEKNVRKKLNFGHTFGHAIEGFLLGTEHQIAHGQAVAQGIICESYASFVKGLIDFKTFETISNFVKNHFSMISIDEDDFTSIMQLMKNDKKNKNSKILCVLLTAIGVSEFDQELSEKEIYDVFNYVFVAG